MNLFGTIRQSIQCSEDSDLHPAGAKTVDGFGLIGYSPIETVRLRDIRTRVLTL